MSTRPSLMQVLADARKVVFVGLAKNTGKTVAVTTLIGELSAHGRSLGITSIGRDGEEFDAIRPQIRKPSIFCPAGTLVATTQPLLRRSAPAHEVLVETDLRTPLGRVVVARLLREGRCEIAGPSSSVEIQAMIEEMLSRGVDSVIVDGSIDRRAAATPPIADAVVVATGAVLGPEIQDVVAATARAFSWATIAPVEDPRTRDLAAAAANRSLLALAEDVIPLPSAFALTVEPRDLWSLLGTGAGIEPVLLVGGVVPESLLEALLPHGRRSRVRVIAGDPTKVFVKSKSVEWYRRRGVSVEVLRRARLGAVTVNPVKPPSGRLNSERLCQAIGESLKHRVPVLDVLGPSYRGAESWPRPADRRVFRGASDYPAPVVERAELKAIFLGGAAGALVRAGLVEALGDGAPSWPWVTFAVNVVGAFLLGYFVTRLQERLPLSTYKRPLLGTGFCGALTTFSTMQVELLKMLDAGRVGLAVTYGAGSVLAGYAGVQMASAMVRRLRLRG